MSDENGDLPPGWTWCTVGEVAHVDGGLTKNAAKRNGVGREVPLVTVGSVGIREVRPDDFGKIWVDESERDKATLMPGDILVVEGNGSLEHIGRVAIWTNGLPDARHQNHLLRVRARRGVLPEFLLDWLASPDGREDLVQQATSAAGLYNLSISKVSRVEAPLAPLPEQRRIVAKLDDLRARSRRAREALDEVPVLLDQLKQSVLAAAFRGDLTADWRAKNPDVEPASVLLDRLERTPRPNRWESRSRSVIPGHHGLAVGNPGTPLPRGWAWTPLAEVARLESGHTPSREHPEWWGGDVPWLSIPDARDHHATTIHRTADTTNELGLANSAARLLAAGTVCLCRTAASKGYVTVLGVPMATSQDFVNWTCTEAVDPHWLKYLFVAEKEALITRFSKGSTHTTIYFPEVLAFHVALPPIREQREVVLLLEERLRALRSISTALGSANGDLDSLDQAILAKAFRGELVPQDPNDEPADVLLARIKAEAGAAPRPARRGRGGPAAGAER